MFVGIVLILWFIYVLVLQKKLGYKFMLSKELLPLIFISFISIVCLGVNYVVSAIPRLNDGIGMANSLAYWIIGEDNWSVGLFKRYFDSSVYVGLFLILLYSILRLVEKDRRR